MAPTLGHTAPDLSNLFNLTLPPPPPLSSSGLLRPFVPIVPVGMLATLQRQAPSAVVIKEKARTWQWFASIAIGLSVGLTTAFIALPNAPMSTNAPALPRAPRTAEVVEAKASFGSTSTPVDLAEALARVETPRAAAPATLERPKEPEAHAPSAPNPFRNFITHDDDAQSPLGKARIALKKGDLSNANFAYAEATGVPSLAVDGFVGLGDIAARKGDYPTAKRRYESATAIAPRYFAARLGLADCAWDSGDRTSGRAQYRALAHEYPKGMLPARAFERAK